MRRWTQEEYDAVKSENGLYHLGSGDFRGVDFRSRHGVIIGPNSMLGSRVRLGVGCRIGDYTTAGDDFCDQGNLKIGEHCHFGERAEIGENAVVGRATCFASGVKIGADTTLCEDVQLPAECGYLFNSRAIRADGRSLIRMSPVAGRTICAFTAEFETGRTTMVVMHGLMSTLEEFERRTQHLLAIAEAEGAGRRLMDAQDLHAAAMYIKAHFERRAA